MKRALKAKTKPPWAFSIVFVCLFFVCCLCREVKESRVWDHKFFCLLINGWKANSKKVIFISSKDILFIVELRDFNQKKMLYDAKLWNVCFVQPKTLHYIKSPSLSKWSFVTSQLCVTWIQLHKLLPIIINYLS